METDTLDFASHAIELESVLFADSDGAYAHFGDFFVYQVIVTIEPCDETI